MIVGIENSFKIFIFASFLIVADSFCPSTCVCTDDQPAVDCDNANLSSFPILLNPRTRSLTLSNNRISTLTLDELSFYSELEYLDLSYNKVLTIERGAFFRLQKLKVLRLNGNLLASLAVETFAGLSDLRVLDLSDNGINRLATSIFSDLPRLESLNLSKNSINTISPGALTNLRHLKEIHLRHNDLKTIPHIALHATPSLKILDLSYNRIDVVGDESFAKLKMLESLNLAGNGVELIEDEAFVNLHNLRQLYLETNQLYRVPTMSFRHLSELHTLTIGENLFTELPTSGFEGLNRLKQLVVTRCPHLTSTALNAFSGLYELETLILSENRKLTNLHEASFEQNVDVRTSLRQVFLFDNNLSNIPTTLLPFGQLTELDLRRNPWRCDCDLSFIGDVLRRIYDGDESRVAGAHCNSPESFKNRLLISLAVDEFQCQTDNDMPLVVTVVAVVGALLAITVVLLLVVRFRRRLGDVAATSSICSLCSPASSTPTTKKRTDHVGGDRRLGKNFYERQNFITMPYSGFSSLKKQSNCHANYPPSMYGYETPNEHQAFLATSDYYSSGGSYLSPETQSSTLTREGSFRVIQHYPIPITEL